MNDEMVGDREHHKNVSGNCEAGKMKRDFFASKHATQIFSSRDHQSDRHLSL